MIWVIDASVALRWFINEEFDPLANEVLEKLVDQPERFAVPELFCFEVFSVLQRIHPNGLETFQNGIIPLLDMGIFRQPMTASLASKANRFVQLGLTGYDACYAALAEDLKGIWLTYDKKAHGLIEARKVSWMLAKRMPDGWTR